jgi:hypothetical protein
VDACLLWHHLHLWGFKEIMNSHLLADVTPALLPDHHPCFVVCSYNYILSIKDVIEYFLL